MARSIQVLASQEMTSHAAIVCYTCTFVMPRYVHVYIVHCHFRHYVSNFAHDLLERIHYDPVFDVQNVNPQIYSTVSLLAQARVRALSLCNQFIMWLDKPVIPTVSSLFSSARNLYTYPMYMYISMGF